MPVSRPPAPLLLAVAAVPHAAPLSAMAFASIDKVDIAVGGAAFPYHPPIDPDKQVLDRQGTSMERQVHWLLAPGRVRSRGRPVLCPSRRERPRLGERRR